MFAVYMCVHCMCLYVCMCVYVCKCACLQCICVYVCVSVLCATKPMMMMHGNVLSTMHMCRVYMYV